MEETTPLMNFMAAKDESSYIKVIGVGGGGTNAVNHMYREGITGVDFIVCNTDAKSLASSPVTNKIQLGDGLGAGNNPEVAKRYASENVEAIRNTLSENTKMLFITAGMGGGTGTGASPIIAQIAKEIDVDDKDVPKILVVAIVTMPFNFEGVARKEQAEEGVKELRKYVDSILIIDNNKVLGGEKMAFSKAFAKADDVLLTAAKSVAEMITVKAYINTDFRDVNTVMKDSGTALMGAGIAEGENRAIEAIQNAIDSPLLNDNDISDSRKILLHITCSEEDEFDTEEMEEVTQYITSICKYQPTIIWGIGYDNNLEGKVRIIVVATGFQTSSSTTPPTGGGFDGVPKGPEDFSGKNDFIQHPKTPEKQEQQVEINESKEDTRVVVPLDFPKQEKLEFADNSVEPKMEESPIDTIFTVSEKTEQTVTQQQPAEMVNQPQSVEHITTASESINTIQSETVIYNDEETKQRDDVSTEQELEAKKKVLERVANIKKIKKLVDDPNTFASFENKPSFERQGMILPSLSGPDQDEMAKNIVDKDGNIIPNSCVFTTVD